MFRSGFTLIELMIVIAIIAILAGMAIIPYTYYMRKAKAKELITLARACVQEAVAQCVENANFNNFESLATCSHPTSETSYLENIQITPSGSCSSGIMVSASGKIKGDETTFTVTCSYNSTSDQIICTQPLSTL